MDLLSLVKPPVLSRRLSTFSLGAVYQLCSFKQPVLKFYHPCHIRCWWGTLLCLHFPLFRMPLHIHPPGQPHCHGSTYWRKHILCSATKPSSSCFFCVLFCCKWRSVFMYPGSELHVSSLWDLQSASRVALKTSLYTALLLAPCCYLDSGSRSPVGKILPMLWLLLMCLS